MRVIGLNLEGTSRSDGNRMLITSTRSFRKN